MSPKTSSPKTSFVVRAAAAAVTSCMLALFFTGTAYAVNPVIWPTVTNGIGASASPTHLLVTVPWCQTNNLPPRQVLSIDSMGMPHVFVTLPNQPGCNEQKVTISPGLPGFPPNFVYVTQGSTILEITPDGSSTRVFTTLPDASPGHVNVIFDQIGLFGYRMIATGGDTGTVYVIGPDAVPHLLATVPSAAAPVHIETGDIITTGPFLGHLLVSAEDQNAVYRVTPAGAVTGFNMVDSAEAVRVIPSTFCTFQRSGGFFFDVVYGDLRPSDGQIRVYPPSDFTGLAGKILISSEEMGYIDIVNPDATPFLHLWDRGINRVQEGATFVNCRVPSGCVRTQGWWKNQGAAGIPRLLERLPGMMLMLGKHGYTPVQLAAIYGQPVRGNGLISLAHQLITAKLNALTGAAVPQEIVEAIRSADMMIGKLMVPPVGTGSLNPSATGALTDTLDHYNNGQVWFGPPHCSD